jgi:hypothetical protein
MKTIRYIIAALYCLAYMLLADTVTLAWDANPEPNLFYRVSYGLASGQHVTDLPLVTGTETTTPLLLPGTTYYFIVRAVNSKGLMSPPSNEVVYTLPLPNEKGWTVAAVSEEQADGYAAELAIDGDPNTFWHTLWRDGTSPATLPHFIAVDMTNEKTLGGFTYLPRQDAYEHGEVRDYEFHLSLDGAEWGLPVVSGTMSLGKSLQTISFDPRAARFFRLTILTSAGGKSFASIAELGVVEAIPLASPSTPRNFRISVKPPPTTP